MTTEQLIKYLKEGTKGSDVTKTDVFLDSLMREAAAKIEVLLDEKSDLSWAVENARNNDDYYKRINDYYKRTQWR